MKWQMPVMSPRVAAAAIKMGGTCKDNRVIAPAGLQWKANGFSQLYVGCGPTYPPESSYLEEIAQGFEPRVHHTMQGVVVAVELIGGTTEWDPKGRWILRAPKGFRWWADEDIELATPNRHTPPALLQDYIDELMSSVHRGFEPLDKPRRLE